MERRRRRKPVNIAGIIIAVMIVIGLIGLFIFVIKKFEIKSITITGSDKYTYEELYEYIFENRDDRNLLMFKYTNERNEMPEIPFISKIAVEVKDSHTLEITVYEKTVVGYVSYKGTNMYFDKDGVVVEASTQVLLGVPEVSGLNFDSIVMHQKLVVGDDDVFGTLLNVTQYLEKYNIPITEINVENDNSINVIMDEVTVKLGSDTHDIGIKIFELSCMLDKLSGKKGTLYMEDFKEGQEYITFIEKE